MKPWLIILSILWTAVGFAADKPAPPTAGSLSGKVLEVQHVENFTYLRVKTKEGETWAATNRAQIEKGAEVTLINTIVMTDFESKSLKKKFDRIVFGSLASGAAGAHKDIDLAKMHAGVAAKSDVPDVKVPKASGPNARTVAEIVTGRAALKDKKVLVRGRVVRYNPAILGINWIHLRDGSGSAADKTNDLLVTTKSETKVGDVVLVKGVVRTDKDFGSGYTYHVLVEASEVSSK